MGLFAQTATPPSNGDGSLSDPYTIETLDNLYWLTQNSTEWDKYYIQTADIDASLTSSWDSGSGFLPIGNNTTKFTGNYDGQGHIVSNLTVNRSDGSLGFFGQIYTGGVVKNLGLQSVPFA